MHINKKRKLKSIEKDYGMKVQKLYDKMKDDNIQDFCDELLKLKEEMSNELKEAKLIED